MNRVEFTSPQDGDARPAQALILDDLMKLGAKDPLEVANPDSDEKVEKQRERFHEFPDDFVAGYVNGKFEGLLRTLEWKPGDQKEYMTISEVIEYYSLKARKAPLPTINKLAITCLVVSDQLDLETQTEMRHGFLERAETRAIDQQRESIVMPLYETDPTLPIALEHGFKGTGRFGDAALLPTIASVAGFRNLGKAQELFEKPLD